MRVGQPAEIRRLAEIAGSENLLPKGFDPARRASDNIARKLYSVSGIPTFYIVDKEGKILYSGVGAGAATEFGLEKALTQAGLKP